MALRHRAAERGVGQRREVAGRLVVGEHPDPAYVPDLAGEVGAQEDADEPRHLRDGVHPAADGDHVGVVVLPGQRRGLVAPGERGADTLHLVGGDLLAVAGTADHDAETALVGDDGLGGAEAEHRVVVLGVVHEGAVVDRLVALLAQPADQVVLQLEAGVVGSQVDAHETDPCRPPGTRTRQSVPRGGVAVPCIRRAYLRKAHRPRTGRIGRTGAGSLATSSAMASGSPS